MAQNQGVSLTMAIAAEAAVGVVIDTRSNRYSRMYRWDLESDRFVGGQFVKARMYAQAVSPDGKYVAYGAEHHEAPIPHYLAVSHVGYFTALAFFPVCIAGCISFDDGRIVIGTKLTGPSRIVPGCPFEIVFESDKGSPPYRHHVEDAARNRILRSDGDLMVATDQATGLRSVVGAFRKEPFEAVEPPAWVREWSAPI